MPESNQGNRQFINRKISSRRMSTRTVYNPNNSLFNKLTKFFSGPITKYKTPDIANPKRKDMLKYKYSDIHGVPLKRQDEYANFNQAQTEQNLNALRLQRYAMYDQMEMSPPEISKALDIYAGEITTYTDYSPILKIESPKDEIKEILTTLWFDVLGVEQNLFDWTRTLVKNGDLFLFSDIDPELGVTALRALPVTEIERLEGEDPTNPNYVQFQWNKESLTFENVEICHFRILGNEKFYPYGCSVLYPALKIVQQLNLMIEHMMSYRMVRSAERLAFYYDVTGLEADKVEAFIENNLKNTLRQTVTNSNNGLQSLRFDAPSVNSNYHLPIKKGSETRIEPLPGGQLVGAIEDIELLRDQMFTALGIPGSYMSNKNNDGEQTSLAQKSMLFARTILRIQNSIISEFRKVSLIHLMCLGYSGDDLLNIKFKLNNPSKLAEMQEFEHLKLKFEIAGAAGDQGWSKRKIQTELWGWTPEEIHRNIYEILGDAKFQMMLSNIENQVGTQGLGGGAGDFAGLGPGGDGGIEGLDQMMQGNEPPSETEDQFANIDTGNEENGLLVQPDQGSTQPSEKNRRNDVYLTPRAKAKQYSPTKMDGRQTGQRLNNFNSKSGRNSVRGINKNIFPGMSALNSVRKGIFPENNEIDKDESLINEADNFENDIVDILKESKEKSKKVKEALKKYNFNELLKEAREVKK